MVDLAGNHGRQCVCCQQISFLPARCNECMQTLCGDCIVPAAHGCASLRQRGEQGSPAEAAGAYSYSCSHVKCKKKELMPIVCRDCKGNFCIGHRAPAAHSCGGASSVDAFPVGRSIQVLSSTGQWRVCTVVQSDHRRQRRPSIKVHYAGFDPKYDETIDLAREAHRLKREPTAAGTTGGTTSPADSRRKQQNRVARLQGKSPPAAVSLAGAAASRAKRLAAEPGGTSSSTPAPAPARTLLLSAGGVVKPVMPSRSGTPTGSDSSSSKSPNTSWRLHDQVKVSKTAGETGAFQPGYRVGATLQALSSTGKWRQCTIVSHKNNPPRVEVHFEGFAAKYNELVDITSESHRLKIKQ